MFHAFFFHLHSTMSCKPCEYILAIHFFNVKGTVTRKTKKCFIF
jgi:hypothetical protein